MAYPCHLKLPSLLLTWLLAHYLYRALLETSEAKELGPSNLRGEYFADFSLNTFLKKNPPSSSNLKSLRKEVQVLENVQFTTTLMLLIGKIW